MQKIKGLFLNYLFKFIIIILIGSLSLYAQDNKNQKNNRYNLTSIEADIKYFHQKISEDILFYKKLITNNSFSMELNLGKHRYSSDLDNYVYRNRVFFYFNGTQLKSLSLVYQQIDDKSFFTETRRCVNKDITGSALDNLELNYASWTVDQEESSKIAKINSFADLIDEDLYPLGAKYEKFKVSELGKDKQKYKTLLTYRDNLRLVLRTLEYQIQLTTKTVGDNLNRSLKLGVND